MARHVSRIIHAPRARIWELLTHTSHWPKWGPSIASVSCTDTPIKQGSVGSVRLSFLPLSVPFTITEYAHLESWSWRVAGQRATTHRLKELEPGVCEVSFGVPSAIFVPYLKICEQALKRIEEMCA